MYKPLIRRWWVFVLRGLLAVLLSAGIALGLPGRLRPDAAALFLLALVSTFCMADGLCQMVAALELLNDRRSRWLLCLGGTLSLLFGVLLLLWPAAGPVVLLPLAACALAHGALLLSLGLRLRVLRRLLQTPGPPARVFYLSSLDKRIFRSANGLFTACR